MQMQMQATDDRGQPTHLYLSISMERRQGGRRQAADVVCDSFNALHVCIFASSRISLGGSKASEETHTLREPHLLYRQTRPAPADYCNSLHGTYSTCDDEQSAPGPLHYLDLDLLTGRIHRSTKWRLREHFPKEVIV
jgi:hypothetical protein